MPLAKIDQNAKITIDKKVKAERKAKAIALKNSAPLDVHVWSAYLEINSVVDKLFKDINGATAFKGISRKRVRRHLKIVVLDLYVKYLTDPTLYSAYHRNRNKYAPKSRYNSLNISVVLKYIIDALVTKGYIENYPGINSPTIKKNIPYEGYTKIGQVICKNPIPTIHDRSCTRQGMCHTA